MGTEELISEKSATGARFGVISRVARGLLSFGPDGWGPDDSTPLP